MEHVKKERRGGDTQESVALHKVSTVLLKNEPAQNAVLDEEEELAIKSLGLLTRKPMIYAANVADVHLATGNDMPNLLVAHAKNEGAMMVLVLAQVESELVDLDTTNRTEFLALSV